MKRGEKGHMKKRVKPTDEHYNELIKELHNVCRTGDTQRLKKLHEELKVYGDKAPFLLRYPIVLTILTAVICGIINGIICVGITIQLISQL